MPARELLFGRVRARSFAVSGDAPVSAEVTVVLEDPEAFAKEPTLRIASGLQGMLGEFARLRLLPPSAGSQI